MKFYTFASLNVLCLVLLSSVSALPQSQKVEGPKNPMRALPLASNENVGIKVNTEAELLAALKSVSSSSDLKFITVASNISLSDTLKVPSGFVLKGSNKNIALNFKDNVDGIELSKDNYLSDLKINVSPKKRAVYNSYEVSDLSKIHLSNLETVGSIQILGKGSVKSGDIWIDNVNIKEADLSPYNERPKNYNVFVLQGALTVYNLNTDGLLTTNIYNVNAGSKDKPIVGCGVFVFGKVKSNLIYTDTTYIDSKIPVGTANLITGGTFVGDDAEVNHVVTKNAYSYGVNDMGNDNWGTVKTWVITGKTNTYGTSAIGFVNFGTMGLLDVKDTIECFGPGARGFNSLNNGIGAALFKDVITHGDGAVGILLRNTNLNVLSVSEGIKTFGGVGQGLVEGQIKDLTANGLVFNKNAKVSLVTVSKGVSVKSELAKPIASNSAAKVDLFMLDGTNLDMATLPQA